MKLTFLLNVALPAAFAGSALAHGVITSPTPRAPGANLQKVCGAGITEELSKDLTAPVEYAVGRAGADTTADCSLFLCRGLRFEDNLENVQTFSAGTTVPIEIDLRVKHAGYANVSIVDVHSQTTIGEPLATWAVYADPAQPSANETSFAVTIPDLGGACANAGACTLQWYWYGVGAAQTFESCVDFVQNPKARGCNAK